MIESIFSLDKDILSPAQKEFWLELCQVFEMGFVSLFVRPAL